MTHYGRRRDSERGQILVLVAGGLIALLTLAALGIEGGMLVLNRRDVQNATDLASLAGSREVALRYVNNAPSTPQSTVYGAVADALVANGCDSTDNCTWAADFVNGSLTSLGSVTNTAATIPTGSLGVLVSATRPVNAILGKVIGFSTWNVSTDAAAIAARPTTLPTGIMLPIAVCGWSNATGDDCAQATNAPAPGNFIDFQTGQVYDLTDGKDAPGGFGWLSWDGSNAAGALADAICTPQNPQFSLDSPYDNPGSYGGVIGTNPSTGETWFPIDPGKSNKNTVRSCLDKWIQSGATVLVPIYDLVTGNGNNAAYHITGVAAFVLTSREQPAVDNIQGYFVEYYSFTNVPGGATSNPPDPSDQTYFLGLVK